MLTGQKSILKNFITFMYWLSTFSLEFAIKHKKDDDIIIINIIGNERLVNLKNEDGISFILY